MKIRKALPEDRLALLALLKQFQEESLSHFGTKIEDDYALRMIDGSIQNSFVAEKEGKVVGVMSGIFTTELITKRKIFQETIWFMDKEYRKYGIKLYRHVENWVREQGCEAMLMGCLSNSKFDKLVKFYEKIGYKHLESQFMKELT